PGGEVAPLDLVGFRIGDVAQQRAEEQRRRRGEENRVEGANPSHVPFERDRHGNALLHPWGSCRVGAHGARTRVRAPPSGSRLPRYGFVRSDGFLEATPPVRLPRNHAIRQMPFLQSSETPKKKPRDAGLGLRCRAGSLDVEKTAQLLRAARVAQLPQRLGLYLADPLAG